MSGWIKLHRKITEWEWYCDPNTFRLFMHLIVTANHNQETWRGTTVERGQLATGRESLSRELRLSQQEIRTSLDKLKMSGNIAIKSTNKFSVITVCNYEKYNKIDIDLQPANQPANQPTSNSTNSSTSKSTSKNNEKPTVNIDLQPANQPANQPTTQPQTRSKEIKNKRLVQKTSPRGFEKFWESYPRKQKKKEALSAWNKLNCGNGMFDTIMQKLEQFKQSDSWTRDNGRYIPNPASWINGERWNDEVECQLPSKGQKIGGLTF
jgi:hypothetical protein